MLEISECVERVHSLDVVFGNLSIDTIHITSSFSVLLPLPLINNTSLSRINFSPEYILEHRINPSFDIWCIGIILYQLLFQSLPFQYPSDLLYYISNSYKFPHFSLSTPLNCLTYSLLNKDYKNRINIKLFNKKLKDYQIRLKKSIFYYILLYIYIQMY